MVLMAVGSVVLATSFKPETLPNGDEEQLVDEGKAVGGAFMMGIGLGVGIAGLALTPSQGERARAESYRYTFVPENDPPDEVEALDARYNEQVRAPCAEPIADEEPNDDDETERPED
jgi:hypothetical protein